VQTLLHTRKVADVGAEFHWQQGGWLGQQHAAGWDLSHAADFTLRWHPVCLGNVLRVPKGKNILALFLLSKTWKIAI